MLTVSLHYKPQPKPQHDSILEDFRFIVYCIIENLFSYLFVLVIPCPGFFLDRQQLLSAVLSSILYYQQLL
jgi:hypothetical protein